MENLREHLRDISEIRTMMENQTKFLSLSGLSGICAGICALIGGGVAWWYLGEPLGLTHSGRIYIDLNTIVFFFLDAGLTLTAALSLALFFSYRMAKKKDLPFMNDTAFKVLVNLAVPLVAGGILATIQVYHGIGQFVPSTTLIFYGLALLNASKYTFPEIRYLGLSELFLGLICAFFWQTGLIFWMVGFGLLHIIYGAVMYYKYER